jgi:hypothetical protein
MIAAAWYARPGEPSGRKDRAAQNPAYRPVRQFSIFLMVFEPR